MIVIRDSKTFYFYFDWCWWEFKHEIEFIIKSNESLAENEIKNKTEQLLSKCKYGGDIHEHGKQRNKWTT